MMTKPCPALEVETLNFAQDGGGCYRGIPIMLRLSGNEPCAIGPQGPIGEICTRFDQKLD
jgi:hypothetical protein